MSNILCGTIKPSQGKINEFKQSINFAGKKFLNQIPTVMDTSITTSVGLIREFIKGNPNGRPNRAIPVEPYPSVIRAAQSSKVTWFGHSTLLLEIL